MDLTCTPALHSAAGHAECHEGPWTGAQRAYSRQVQQADMQLDVLPGSWQTCCIHAATGRLTWQQG